MITYKEFSSAQRAAVTQICKVYLPVRGGVQAIAERVGRIISDEFDVSVLTTSPHPEQASMKNGIKVSSIKSWGELMSLPIAPGLIPAIWRSFRKTDVLVVHYPFPLADLAIALARFLPMPPLVVYWHSEIVSQRFSRWLVRPFTRQMLKRCRAVVVSSPNLIEHSALLAQVKNKCHVIPFGYQPRTHHESEQSGDYFLFVGRHVPYKGIDVLIRATADSTAKVVVVGDGPLLEQHKELAGSLQTENRLEFRTGVSDQEMARLMAGCKALVLPSVLPSEAFALVQIEAMSHGKPVINTALKSGVPWVARHQREGLTVPPGDAGALASAMQRMNEDDKLVQRLGEAARRRWREVFSMPGFEQATKNLFRELMHEPEA